MIRALDRLRRSASLVVTVLLILVLIGIALPRLITFLAERLFQLRSTLAQLTGHSGDISPGEQVSVFWRLVAWLREFYVGGE